jgi:hypothetical protein
MGAAARPPMHDAKDSSSSTRHHVFIEPLEARIAPATFLITNLKDSGPGSFREALEDANAAAGPDFIKFGKSAAGTLKLIQDLPEVTDSVTISGPGAARLTVHGMQHQIFAISGEKLTVAISGLKLTGGQAPNGGAVYVDDAAGSVVLSNTVITGNRSVGDSGTAGNDTEAIVPGQGGGIAVAAGTVMLVKSTVSGNKAGEFFSEYDDATSEATIKFVASGKGGGIDVEKTGLLKVRNSVITTNRAADGGGIHNAGKTAVENRSIISKNIARQLSPGEIATGGGISNAAGGTLTLTNSRVSGNLAIGADGVAVGYYDAGTPAGSAAVGGGIFNAKNATLSVLGSKVLGNKAIGGVGVKGETGAPGDAAADLDTRSGGRGAAGETGGAGGNASGGGIANAGKLILKSSRVTGNASIGGAGGSGGRGGTGGEGAYGLIAQTYYDEEIPAVPPGPGGPGGPGGLGGAGGAAIGGGIFSSTKTVTISASVVSGNSQIRGLTGTKGPVGAAGAAGADAEADTGGPYYYA